MAESEPTGIVVDQTTEQVCLLVLSWNKVLNGHLVSLLQGTARAVLHVVG